MIIGALLLALIILIMIAHILFKNQNENNE